MRVVCDTNILVSAFLSPYGPPAKVVELFLERKLCFCYDARILAEYEEVLIRPKFRIPPERIRYLLDAVRMDGELVHGRAHSVKLRDPDNQSFLEVAVAGEVECLITGNAEDFKRHTPPPSILSPSQFLNQYRRILFE
jgi:uncharacterized protein